MKHTFRYIVLAAVLLSPTLSRAQTAGAPPIYGEGYKIEGGVATRKSVSSTMDSNGYYTLKLETFATGVTSITQKAVPSDVVLVLDLSTSMGGHRGELTELEAPVSVSYNDIMNLDEDGDCYVRWYDEHGFGYEILGIQRNGRYYLYWQNPNTKWYGERNKGGVKFFKYDGTESEGFGSLDVTTAPLPTPAEDYSTTDPYQKFWTFPAGTPGKNHPDVPYDSAEPDHANYCHATVHKSTNARLRELKQSTLAFIDEIVTNDRYRIVNGQKVPRDNRLGNRLSIVSFAGSVINDYSTNLLDLTDANVETLKNLVKSFTMQTGTKPHFALQNSNGGAQTRFTNRQGMIVGEDYFRTVVFFTDGKPDKPNDNATVQDGMNLAINEANNLKNNLVATVYSVGLFGDGDLKAYPQIPNFMRHVSSEWLNSTTLDNGTQNTDGVQYYHDASDDDMSLADIFKTIAQASGGSEKTIPGATQVVDGVTNSFTIPTPQGATAPTIASAQVRVYTQSINIAGTAWTTDTPDLYLIEMSDDECESPDMTKSYMTDEDKVGVAVKNGRLIVMGFNYSKADTDDTSLDGNWVGWRYPRQVQTCAGKELVIEFKIKGDPSATGGDDTQTNTGDSGIFIPQYDATGNFIGYEPVNQYNVPIADIPINLVIKKVGMRHGESATIQIYRAPVSDNYNTTTGKLKPDLTNGWSNFSKVIMTNWGADGDVVTETLLCLDPKYVYKLEEDNWGWAYELDDKSIDTSEQEKNPFVFTNTEKTDAVKHAEAATLNRFGNELHGRERKQTVKSSKTKTFISTPATGE